MMNEIFVNAVPIIYDRDIPPRSEINIVDIRCTKCRRIVSLKVFRAQFLISPYVCISCVKRGTINPFYGKHHSYESKLKIGGAVCDYNGSNNPFYGKHHSIETIHLLKKNPKCIHRGDNNAFYGKHHSDRTKAIIIEKNNLFRKNYPDQVLQNNLTRIGKNKDDFEHMLNEYILPATNKICLSKKYGIDFRTMKYYWIFFKMITPSELHKLTKYKQLFSNPSYPEQQLYEMLAKEYGAENVIHCYELGGYYYDICLFGKILIEYDGYYWHRIIKNKNDVKKSKVAITNGYILYRVGEPSDRSVDFDGELRNIKYLLAINGLL